MRNSLFRSLGPAGLALACALTLGTALSAQHKPAAKSAAAKAAAPAKLGPGEYATFSTSKGTFVVQLFPKDAPKAVAQFVALASGKQPYRTAMGGLSLSPYYNGLLFFRTIPGYMIQTGDQMNNGTGKMMSQLPFEKNALKFDQAGRMALAQTPDDPTSRGAQIFFTLKPVPPLDKQGYLIIGQIVQGLDVAQALSEGPRRNGQQDVPQYPNILNKVTIQEVH